MYKFISTYIPILVYVWFRLSRSIEPKTRHRRVHILFHLPFMTVGSYFKIESTQKTSRIFIKELLK